MLHVKSRIVIMIFCLIFFNSIFAQETTEKKDVKIGIGVIFHNLWQDLFYDGYTPTIFIPMDLNNNFKIEPEFSFFNNNEKDDDSETNERKIRIGIGLFKRTPKEKTTLYYGIRLAYTRTITKLERDSYDDREIKSSRFFFGPAVGGEYFFSPHFSLGGEVGFRYTTLKSEEDSDSQYYNYDSEGDMTGTKANIFLRYYF